jgi:uncharacterized protein (TIGR03437 family)
VPAGAASAPFSATTATITSNSNATITATYNSSSANTNVNLVAAVLVSSLSCNPNSLAPNSSSTCTVTLNNPSPSGGVIVSLSDNSSALAIPASVTVTANSSSASFTVTTGSIAKNSSATVTATYNGSSARTSISLQTRRFLTDDLRNSATHAAATLSTSAGSGGPEGNESTASVPQNLLSALSCIPKAIDAGGQSTCELRVMANPTASQIQLSTSSQQVNAPAAVVTRSNQTRLTFQVSAAAVAQQQLVTVTAMAAGATVQDTVQVTAASHPIVTVPNRQAAKLGGPVSFTVSAVDPADLQLQLTASDLPAGATFNTASGGFEWTPGAAQTGEYKVTFTATNSANQSSSSQVSIEVVSGTPTVATVERPCSPGAVASLTGSSLSQPGPALSDPSGDAFELGGARVKVDGQYVPIVSASAAEVDFICPTLFPGTRFEVGVETAAGVSATSSAVMQSASPWIFSLGSQGQAQGMVSFAGSTDLAMARNAQLPAHPAQPGDEILLWGTGLGSVTVASPATVSVSVGGVDSEVEAVNPVPGQAGVYTVQVRVPVPMVFGDAVPVEASVIGSDGKRFKSNGVTIAVEPVIQ